MEYSTLGYILPEIIVASMAALILLLGVFFDKNARFLSYYLSVVTLIAVIIITVAALPVVTKVVVNNTYIIDNFSVILKSVLSVLLLCIFLYSKYYLNTRDFLQGEFFSLSLFSLLGMMVLTSTSDFLTMFLGLELLVLPLYAMIVMVKNQSRYAEGAIKYFIIGSLGAGLLLYGISLVYGACGSFNFSAITQTTDTQHILKLGMLLVIVGIAVEFGSVPFHMWLPDVYEGSPTPVTMVIGTLPKIAIFAIAYRVLSLAFMDLALQWQTIILVLALLSIAWGNIAAIAQTNIKRMLAYSTIGHIGFILLGLAVAPQQGYLAPLFYTIIYAFMALAAFAVIVRLTAHGFEAETIADFRGLNEREPWLAFLMLLIMFSLAGVPPLVGFYAKFLILQSLVDAGHEAVAIVALISTVIAAFYYLRIVKVMYFESSSDDLHFDSNHSMATAGKALVVVNGFALLIFGIAPGCLIQLCLKAFQ